MSDAAAHAKALPNVRLDCELGGDACKPAAMRIYQAARGGIGLQEAELGIKRLVIAYDTDYQGEDLLTVPYNASPANVLTAYQKRAKFRADRENFRKKFASVPVQCTLGESACRPLMEDLYRVVRENGLEAARLDIRQITIEYETKADSADVKLDYNVRGQGLLKALQKRSKP